MTDGIRNVLLITADQWRADCLGSLGHPVLKTPNLDRLAAAGVTFTRHYSQATPCGPGRASLYSGLYLHNHRVMVNGTPLDARHTNIALEARKLGYDPALFGYTDSGADPRVRAAGDPELKTHERILPGMTPIVPIDSWQYPWRAYLESKGYAVPAAANDIFLPVEGPAGFGADQPARARYRAEDSNTAFLTDEALRYMSIRRRQPWFVHLSYWAPHPPFVVPAPYDTLYDPAEAPAPRRHASPAEARAQHPYMDFYLSRQRGMDMYPGDGSDSRVHLSDGEIARQRATYYGMMTEVDHHIGRLLDYLETSGLLEQTLIVFTSDHGEQLGDHWMWAKYGYFEPTFAIPLIVHDPKAPAASRGRAVEAFTENVDVLPTVIDWLGGEVPPQVDGRSLRPWLRGAQPTDWRQEAHWEFDFRDMLEIDGAPDLGLAPEAHCMAAIRDRRYKYVHFADWPALLFDLEKDPDELNNLAGDPASQDLVLHYARKMASWQMTSGDRTLSHLRLTQSGVQDVRHGSRPTPANYDGT